MLHAPVVYRGWPELRYRTGAYPEEISQVFFELFGRHEPTFMDL